MAKSGPAKIAQEVRQEAKKITWPTRKETFVSTGMVFVMVFLAAIFFFLIDQLLSTAVKAIFN
ncbi:Protein translocase subunit SecE [Candidatus Terasakiella magnetica]|uniref:Protein translocase subunit SecE n=1 Tax=Candidatus Terasakiella magnetica TaxID=1867952 RepID=A0A1C3RDF7_9PROT|nr:preprotein translocase subunit SecE [Candidatus Terasakiella magnetica]SCA55316.1 Protein translocase subunit SecE [Candidatus Terasakiella magnetica]